MIAALLLPLMLSAADPAIRVWINQDGRFVPGDYARIQVWTKEPGYLLILQADPNGQLRVLFPLNPGDNNYLPGGERYELKDRDGREGFTIDATSGHGMVYAAVSPSPFHFSQYRRIDSWDYQALAPAMLPPEPESELTDLVARMAPGDFDHDVVTYEVIERVVYATDNGADSSHTFVPDGFADGWFVSPFFLGCSPFFFDCSPFAFAPCFQCPFFFNPFFREPALITRFGPRRFVPGTGAVASVRDRRSGAMTRGAWPVDVSRGQQQPVALAQRGSWPVDLSPRSLQLAAMARRANWPMDVSPRPRSPGPGMLLHPMSGGGIGLRARMEPVRLSGATGFSDGSAPEPVSSPGLRSFVPHATPSLHGLGLRPR